jgi:hypothetical protein
MTASLLSMIHAELESIAEEKSEIGSSYEKALENLSSHMSRIATVNIRTPKQHNL